MLSPSRKNEFIELLRKYQQQRASPKEIEFLKQYYNYFNQEEKASLGMSPKELQWLENRLFQRIEKIIESSGQNVQPAPARIFTLRKVAAAAVLILILGTGTYELHN